MNLAGTWVYAGNASIVIAQCGDKVLANWLAQGATWTSATGTQSGDTLTLTFGAGATHSGKLTSDGTQILWDNNTTWRRNQSITTTERSGESMGAAGTWVYADNASIVIARCGDDVLANWLAQGATWTSATGTQSGDTLTLTFGAGATHSGKLTSDGTQISWNNNTTWRRTQPGDLANDAQRTSVLAEIPAIEIASIEIFHLKWSDKESGGDHDGAFYRPIPPAGFHSLGDLGQSNYNTPTPTPCAIAVKALVPDALARPVRFELVWEDSGSGANQDGSFWRPIPPAGYRALGLVANNGHTAPSLDCVICVKQDYLVPGELSDSIWNDAGTGSNSDFGSWKVVSRNDKSFISTTFSGHASHDKPSQCAESWALNADFVRAPQQSLATATSTRFSQNATRVNINKGGYPLDYHSIAGFRMQHCQDMIRLPDDADGNRYYMGTFSQNVSDTEGGMVFVARRDRGTGNGGTVIWCDILNNKHPMGGCNHPGDLRRLGNIVVIAGQDWDKDSLTDGINIGGGAAIGALAGSVIPVVGTLVGAGIGALVGSQTTPADPLGRGNGGQNILFYDVSNPANPKRMGRLNTFMHNGSWISLDTDIDSITLHKVDDWYYLAFNGIKSTKGLVCRARILSPNACWTSVQTGNLGSPIPMNIAGSAMMASPDESGTKMKLVPFPFGKKAPDQMSGTFPPSAFGDGTTFSVSTLPGGKSYVVRTNVNADSIIQFEEIESI